MRQTVLREPSGQTPKQGRNPHDASLLFCCMDVLQIDHDKLDRNEPLLYRELQGICSLCPNKRECALDLSGGFDRHALGRVVVVLPELCDADNDRRVGEVRQMGKPHPSCQAQPSAGGLNILAEQYLKKTAPRQARQPSCRLPTHQPGRRNVAVCAW